MPAPPLGRGLAVAVVLLAVMVGLGVFWVWRTAHREQSWRDRVNSQEAFEAPSRTTPAPPSAPKP